MNELTNQECRDLPGSLSNRGCYFDEEGNVIVTLRFQKKATHFSCLDCGGKFERVHEFHRVEKTKFQGRVVRPLCAACHLIREEKEEQLSTGLPTLDRLLDGGIPAGELTTMVGRLRSGKTRLGDKDALS